MYHWICVHVAQSLASQQSSPTWAGYHFLIHLISNNKALPETSRHSANSATDLRHPAQNKPLAWPFMPLAFLAHTTHSINYANVTSMNGV